MNDDEKKDEGRQTRVEVHQISSKSQQKELNGLYID